MYIYIYVNVRIVQDTDIHILRAVLVGHRQLFNNIIVRRNKRRRCSAKPSNPFDCTRDTCRNII